MASSDASRSSVVVEGMLPLRGRVSPFTVVGDLPCTAIDAVVATFVEPLDISSPLNPNLPLTHENSHFQGNGTCAMSALGASVDARGLMESIDRATLLSRRLCGGKGYVNGIE